MTSAQAVRCCELYGRGLSVRRVAEIMDLTHPTVARVLRDSGIAIERHPDGRLGSTVHAERARAKRILVAEEVGALLREGRTLRQAAKLAGVSDRTAARALDEFGDDGVHDVWSAKAAEAQGLMRSRMVSVREAAEILGVSERFVRKSMGADAPRRKPASRRNWRDDDPKWLLEERGERIRRAAWRILDSVFGG